MTSTPLAPPRHGTRRGHPVATLIAVSLGLFMVGLDATVVSIANPAIAASLGTSFTELQWITHAYLLGLAVCLILGGTLGDRFGRRRMYLIAVVAFALSSVAIGLVGSVVGVIAFRALQGISAALLMPQTLSILRATFPREKFGMAVGIWGGVSSVAIAAGPIVGGALVAAIGWESIFFINAPIALITVVFTALVVRESTAGQARVRFDVPGVLLLALGLGGLVLAIVQSEDWGWGDPRTLLILAGAVIVLIGFVLVERRSTHPLLPMSLFREPGFSIGGLAVGANFFALLGVTFFLSLYLMNLRGIDGVFAGVMLLPLSAVSIVASPIGAVLVSRVGPRITLTVGLGLVALSLAALTLTGVDSPYLAMAVPFVTLALGVGFTMTAGADAVVGSAPVHLAGVAGGFQATMLQLGGALGTAVFAAVVGAAAAGGTAGLALSHAEADALAQGVVPAGLTAAETAMAQDAFLAGLHGAMTVGAVVTAVVAVLAFALLRTRRRPAPQDVVTETLEGVVGAV
ncbi:DHA2 family efflux MFS transporter permease subunit [Microbacterium sp. ZW T5_56]|uniref:DHA2 family efflux MFS transporter permease subunit n=1 Tax=Microbacterium sp. ZW T5_56 TaxID=3378081 RepID=UPI003853C99E